MFLHSPAKFEGAAGLTPRIDLWSVYMSAAAADPSVAPADMVPPDKAVLLPLDLAGQQGGRRQTQERGLRPGGGVLGDAGGDVGSSGCPHSEAHLGQIMEKHYRGYRIL